MAGDQHGGAEHRVGDGDADRNQQRSAHARATTPAQKLRTLLSVECLPTQEAGQPPPPV